MSRRKKKKALVEDYSLDLHGIKHSDVDRLVENHVFLTPYPHQIITGNSAEMIRIVIDVLERNNFSYQIGDYNNKGYITVYG